MGTVRIEQQEQGVVATFEGELDIYSVGALKQTLWPALEGAKAVQLELGGVEAIDFAGMQLLAWVRNVSLAKALAFTVQRASPAVCAASRSLRQGAWLPVEAAS